MRMRFVTSSAIACSDYGHDLTEGPRCPYLSQNLDDGRLKLLPTFQYHRRCSLKSRIRYDDEGSAAVPKNRHIQTAGILSEAYGVTIDSQAASTDRFYAMSEFFKLSAFSQQQALNVMEIKIGFQTNLASLRSERPTLANLLYFRDILDGQIAYLDYMLQLCRNRNKFLVRRRQSSPQQTRSSINQSAIELVSIYQDSLARAQALRKKCTHGMSVISSNSLLAEQSRAIAQAEQVTKLTFAAYVVLPFTLAAAIFGMNFKELGTGTQSIYVFFEVAVPLALASLGFLYFKNLARVIRHLGSRCGKERFGKQDKQASSIEMA